MKRTFAALLALLLTLAGCGSQPAADGRTVLRLDADGSAVLSDAVRLFNAASADYRVVMDTEAPDIVAGGAGYESSNLVDIMPYGALYALPVRWGGMSYGCSKELLDGRLTLSEAEALELLDGLGEGALLFPGWANDVPWQLNAYLPEYDRETELEAYYSLPSLLERVNISSVEQLAAMVTDGALWDTGCPGFGPETDCLTLSILASCGDVEGAWEFLSFVYGPDSRPAIEMGDGCLLPAGAEQLYARLAEQEGVDEAALELARAYVDGMSLRGAA